MVMRFKRFKQRTLKEIMVTVKAQQNQTKNKTFELFLNQFHKKSVIILQILMEDFKVCTVF